MEKKNTQIVVDLGHGARSPRPTPRSSGRNGAGGEVKGTSGGCHSLPRCLWLAGNEGGGRAAGVAPHTKERERAGGTAAVRGGSAVATHAGDMPSKERQASSVKPAGMRQRRRRYQTHRPKERRGPAPPGKSSRSSHPFHVSGGGGRGGGRERGRGGNVEEASPGRVPSARPHRQGTTRAISLLCSRIRCGANCSGGGGGHPHPPLHRRRRRRGPVLLPARVGSGGRCGGGGGDMDSNTREGWAWRRPQPVGGSAAPGGVDVGPVVSFSMYLRGRRGKGGGARRAGAALSAL